MADGSDLELRALAHRMSCGLEVKTRKFSLLRFRNVFLGKVCTPSTSTLLLILYCIVSSVLCSELTVTVVVPLPPLDPSGGDNRWTHEERQFCSCCIENVISREF